MEFEDNKTDYLKAIDIYGKRITLRFDGEEYFKTRCGAFATILLALSILVVFVLNAVSIYQGKIASFTYMIRNNFNYEDINQRGTYFRH
jgi:nitrogen fixation protein FixH